MSKINKLVKQTELFERLAVFGDRASFLKSLAQAPTDFNGQIRAALTALDTAVSSWISSHGEAQKGLPNSSVTKGIPSSLWSASATIKSLMKATQYDADQLAQAQQAARQLGAVATFTDMSQQGKQAWAQIVNPSVTALLGAIKSQNNYFASIPAPDAEAPASQPASNTAPTAAVSTPAQAAPIAPALQDKLNRLLIDKMLPIKLDGRMGPETLNALKLFRAKYNVPGNYSTQDALDVLKNTNV